MNRRNLKFAAQWVAVFVVMVAVLQVTHFPEWGDYIVIFVGSVSFGLVTRIGEPPRSKGERQPYKEW